MNIIVLGTGDYTHVDRAIEAIASVHKATPISMLATGSLSKLDRAIGQWAATQQIVSAIYDLDHERDGAEAVEGRNRRMIARTRPDLVLLFGHSLVTRDMSERAAELGVPVQLHDDIAAVHTTRLTPMAFQAQQTRKLEAICKSFDLAP